MNPRVAELFHQLVDLPLEARVQFLSEHPADAATLQEVEQLLAQDTTGTDTLSEAIRAEAIEALRRSEAVGLRCGAFRLLRVVGRGGMGMVYLAERVDGEVAQRAAVKLMNPGSSEVHRERFLRERNILATLTHPNIAHLLDAGHLDDGQPYLAMEYVEGEPIGKCCARFSLRQKVDLMIKICGAVAYLHRNQVVHQDLKPSNILLNALGEPKLLDFGIAKMLNRDATVTQLRMLTPDYASPEQASGGMVGPSSDIYSLGAVLHFLVTGIPPQSTRPSQMAPELKGDLEAILQRTLRHDPKERYESVEEFAADLEAFLHGHPIRARQGDRAYRVRTVVRRYGRALVLTGALTAALVSVGALVWNRSHPVASPQEWKPERLTANTPELAILSAAISPDGKSIAYSDALGIHVRDTSGGATRLLPGTNGHVLVSWIPEGAALRSRVQDAAGQFTMMTVSLSGASQVAEPDEWVPSPDRKHRMRASADGQRLLLEDASGSNSRELWRAAADHSLNAFQWNPNSEDIGVVSSASDISTVETLAIGGAKGHRTVVSPDKRLTITSLVWPRPDRMIVAALESGAAESWNSNLWEIRLPSGDLRKLTSWTDFPIRSGSLTTDGKRLVFIRSFQQRDVYIAAIDAGGSRMGPPRRLTMDLGDDYPTGWTRDSKAVILVSNRNGARRIFRQDRDKQTAEQMVTGPGSQIIPRVTPDGNSILFLSNNRATQTSRLMRAAIAGGAPEPLPDIPQVRDFRCSPAGPCEITQQQGTDYVTSEFDPLKGAGREIFREQNTNAGTPDISPDGKWLASPRGAKIVLRSFATGAVMREIPVRGATNLLSLDYTPDGKGFYSGDSGLAETRLLHIDSSGKSSVLWRQAGNAPIWGVPSPDGKYLALMAYTDDSNVYMVDWSAHQ